MNNKHIFWKIVVLNDSPCFVYALVIFRHDYSGVRCHGDDWGWICVGELASSRRQWFTVYKIYFMFYVHILIFVANYNSEHVYEHTLLSCLSFSLFCIINFFGTNCAYYFIHSRLFYAQYYEHKTFSRYIK